ncbi:MAG TPA: O-methyltransferase [Dongiaceae bacterium]|nr:O-methyltransferase [Dongiaceae bacterium]
MTQDLWTKVDDYICEQLVPADAALTEALRDSRAAGLPDIAVSANQGKMLNLIARLQGAKRILEIGTLGGYSTIWLARALPQNGRLVTCEYSPKHAEVASHNIARAGLANKVEIRVGPALATLPLLQAEEQPPFDLVFIDADKQNNANYVQWALKLTRPGSLIIIDNVVRGGRVIETDGRDEMVEGVRRMNAMIAAEPRLDATAIQTVGNKGYDGFALALVRA